jgi:hypothetical protein
VNQTPEVAVGLASMPAPMTVPAIIMAPPNSDGVLTDMEFSSEKQSAIMP